MGGDPILNCICNSCIDVLSWAVTPQLTAIPFSGDPSWAVTPVIPFSVAIINSDATSTNCDGTLFAIVGGDPQLLALLRRGTFVGGVP